MDRDRHLPTAALFWALLFCPLPTRAAEDGTDKLVTVRAGTLPIIVSAPHGGRKQLAGVAPRQGTAAKQFVTRRDEGTAELAEKLAAAIERRVRGQVYLVIDRVDRKYVPDELSPTIEWIPAC